jgi:hypothetical protein
MNQIRGSRSMRCDSNGARVRCAKSIERVREGGMNGPERNEMGRRPNLPSLRHHLREGDGATVSLARLDHGRIDPARSHLQLRGRRLGFLLRRQQLRRARPQRTTNRDRLRSPLALSPLRGVDPAICTADDRAPTLAGQSDDDSSTDGPSRCCWWWCLRDHSAASERPVSRERLPRS